MIRSDTTSRLYLMRHVEAYKNLSGIHGGGDQRLTPVGVKQALSVAEHLNEQHSSHNRYKMIHQPEERSKTTALIIGAILCSEIINNTDLEGVGLGIVTGLSDEELLDQFPDVSLSLTAWRNRTGDLKSRPRVPGSEPMRDFATRVRKGMSSMIEDKSEDNELVLVGTTSTLNMINHLLVNDGEFLEHDYEFVDFPLGSLTMWKISSARPSQEMPIIVPDREGK